MVVHPVLELVQDWSNRASTHVLSTGHAYCLVIMILCVVDAT